MNAITSMTAPPQAHLQQIHEDLQRIVDTLHEVVVGQDHTIDGVLCCLLAGGHGLLEGVPGLGKTLLVRSIAECIQLEFSRIQFTPDLMPSDVLGTSMLAQDPEQPGRRSLEWQPGPIFANLVLADEINRGTPKTQSALLEAMAESQVTAGGLSRPLPSPFFVLATQNPLEQEGTYPLPEAQLDRFMLHIKVEFPNEDDLLTILERTTGNDEQQIAPVMDAERLLAIQTFIRATPVTSSLKRAVVRMVRRSHPDDPNAPDLVRRYVRYGASPRGAQSLLFAARVRCALDRRLSPSFEDLAWAAPAALRHRILLNFEGQAEGVTTESIVADLVQAIRSQHED